MWLEAIINREDFVKVLDRLLPLKIYLHDEDKPEEKDLRAAIRKFKAEEEEHHDIGLEQHAEQAPAYPLLTALIRGGARLAIEIAKRV